MFVIVWEPSDGGGGGHQTALTLARAEAVCRAMHDVECRIVGADDHAASAVTGRLGRAVPDAGVMGARPHGGVGHRTRRRRRGVNHRS